MSLEGVPGLRRELENSVAAADLLPSPVLPMKPGSESWRPGGRRRRGLRTGHPGKTGSPWALGTEDELARAEGTGPCPRAAAADGGSNGVRRREGNGKSPRPGRIALRVEQIGSDERPGELLFNRKGMERRLAGGVEEWLSVILARRFLETAKEKHERERQPEVIRRAGKYLALMTGNRYTLLSSGGRQGLSVILEGNDPARRRKEEIKWSSGLADQVYLSMRLALATMWGESSEPLPLILDDLLVRFDENRRRGAAEAVIEAARKNQVMLFTCQRKTMEIFRDAAEARGSAPAGAMFHHIDHGTLIPA